MRFQVILSFAALALALPQRGGRGGGGYRGSGLNGLGYLVGDVAGGLLGGVAGAAGDVAGGLIGAAGDVGFGLVDGINDALWGWRRNADGTEVWVPPPADATTEQIAAAVAKHATPLPESPIEA